jgi:signal transduction histidine kinase
VYRHERVDWGGIVIAKSGKRPNAQPLQRVIKLLMSFRNGRSRAAGVSSWQPSKPDVRWENRPLVTLTCAAVLLFVAWMALDRGPLGPALAALASSFVLVLFWGQLIRSEHESDAGYDAQTVLALGRVLGSIRQEPTPREAFAAGARELLQLTGARSLVAALEHRATGRLLLVNLWTTAEGEPRVQVERVPRAHRMRYFAPGPLSLRDFREAHRCDRFAVFDVTVRECWAGRVFLLDSLEHGPADRPGFGALLQQCICALSATRDVPRIRRRAAAHERARLGREIHDGVLQELAAVDVELELIRRQAERPPEMVAASLADIRMRLNGQLRELRHLTERARAYEVDPLRMSTVLAGQVAKFSRDTGIAATFEPPEGQVALPPRVCGEIVRIVQEALVNVRRHSGATHVLVRLACDDAEWKLYIEDDGRGMRTWGTAPVAAGIPIAWRPAVIEERVQSIGGTLTLAPGAGARLEIAIGRGGPWGTRRFESC